MRGVPIAVRSTVGDTAVPLLAVGLAVAGAVSSPHYPSGPHGLAAALSALTALSLVLRGRSVWAMTAAFCAGLVALTVVGIGTTPMWAFLSLLLVSFWTAAGLPGLQAVAGVALLLICAVGFDARSGENGALMSVISPLVIVAAPAAAGVLLRRSRAQATRLRMLSAELAEQRDRAAEAAELSERARIAREIHDVVAHTVSVMLVQAGAAEDLLNPDHPASEPVHAIRATGKQALAELRRVIGVLRASTPADTHPQPSISDLPQLVDSLRGADMHVSFQTSEDLEVLPAGLQLTVFRTVQEALTNARKHAAGATVRVFIARDTEGLHVLVDDDGASQARGGDPGFGLLGLRERAELYGGTLHAGPRADGFGWQVRLDLPAATLASSREPATS